MERFTERGFMCCKVLMCAGFTGWGEGGNWKWLQKGDFVCCNMGMCAVVTGWWRGREMERIR